MAQINLIHTSIFQVPTPGRSALAFNQNGLPGYVNEAGIFTPFTTQDGTPAIGLLANMGVGLESGLPSPVLDGIYVTTDTFKIYRGVNGTDWAVSDLTPGIFVTDTYGSPIKVYQYIGTELYELQFGGGDAFTTDITGTGADYNFNVLHNLHTQTIVVAVYDFDTKETVEAGVAIVDADNITITFDILIALGKKHKIVIK
jgi:hypothetical protein